MTVYFYNYRGCRVKYWVEKDGYYYWEALTFDEEIIGRGKALSRDEARKAAQKSISEYENSD